MQADAARRCRLAVTKIASRCNLDCTYCYMYNMGDESWRAQPKCMSAAVIEALVGRAADHCLAHGIDDFTFALHGGEPLLAGRDRVAMLVKLARARFDALGLSVRFAMQTNGVLLDDAWCGFLAEHGVRVGVSIDATAAAHDRQRVTHRGKGSYARAVAGLRTAQRHGLRPGILSVIDLSADPADTFAHLKELGAERVDLLLPEGNHLLPPAGKGLAARGTPYADWLLVLFEHWWNDPAPGFQVRLFEQIMGATLGARIRADSLGMGENEVLVIETNGDIGPVDVLRVALPGIGASGINVQDHAFDDALAQHAVGLYHGSHGDLPAACRRCPINRICGGGYLSHRYGAAGFDNPSVYCADLTRLITTLRNRALSILPERLRIDADIHPMSFEQARSIQAAAKATALQS